MHFYGFINCQRRQFKVKFAQHGCHADTDDFPSLQTSTYLTCKYWILFLVISIELIIYTMFNS